MKIGTQVLFHKNDCPLTELWPGWVCAEAGGTVTVGGFKSNALPFCEVGVEVLDEAGDKLKSWVIVPRGPGRPKKDEE